MNDFIRQLIEKMDAHQGRSFSTGVYCLDMALRFDPGEFILIAGRTGVGKTSLALQLAENAAIEGGRTVFIYTAEMTVESAMRRMICSRARLCQTDPDPEKFRAAAIKFESAKIIFGEPRSILIDSNSWGPNNAALVIVDSMPRSSSKELKMQALKSRLAVIGVVNLKQRQLREVDQGQSRPQLSELRGMEEDADAVILIHPEWEDCMCDSAIEAKSTELIIAKNRQGPCGTGRAIFLRLYTRFEQPQPERMPEVPA